MDLTLIIADTVTIATKKGLGLGFAKFLLPENSAPSNGILQISAIISPIDALAPPPVKSSSSKTLPRTPLRKKRRTRRRSLSGGGDDDNDGGPEDGEDCGFFGGGSGGGGGGNNWGGRGWNFDEFGGQNWEEYSWNSWSGMAFDFVYEVIFWIALSNCVHFAFKKMVRIVADAERDKVPIRLTSIC